MRSGRETGDVSPLFLYQTPHFVGPLFCLPPLTKMKQTTKTYEWMQLQPTTYKYNLYFSRTLYMAKYKINKLKQTYTILHWQRGKDIWECMPTGLRTSNNYKQLLLSLGHYSLKGKSWFCCLYSDRFSSEFWFVFFLLHIISLHNLHSVSTLSAWSSEVKDSSIKSNKNLLAKIFITANNQNFDIAVFTY